MDIQEITVPVPADRVAEFYRWFADWHEGTLPAVPTAGLRGATAPVVETVVSVDADARFAAAVKWWRSLRPNERGIWGLWIEAAPKLLAADEIVKALRLNGPRDIPGSVSWSDRKGQKVGFKVSWRFDYDPATGAPVYGLRDVDDLSAVEYADLLRRARAEAEA
jgi:hypothetical protein